MGCVVFLYSFVVWKLIKNITMYKNDDPFAPWNDPFYKDDPFAPHNDPIKKDDPFQPWNDPFGKVEDLNKEDREKYGSNR